MIKQKGLFLLGLGFMIFLSINFSQKFQNYVLDFSNKIRTNIVHFMDNIQTKTKTFFHQKEQILLLQKQLQKSEKTAQLSVAFASKLNHFLDEYKLQNYDPDLHFVQALAYVKIGDFTKLWLDFPDFKKDQIYGLLYKGYAAGIVDALDNKPMARLLGDPKMMFSVAIGKEKHLGVVFGDTPNLYVKYIPAYASINVGDEVITSGNDNIFYEGIKVGRVVEIESNNLYKSALVKPYASIQNPNFFYVVDVNTLYIKELNTTRTNDALK